MPMYEYQCGGCEAHFELMQSIHADPEETVCPQCNAKKAQRLLSAFASKIVGDHKTGFKEMKAYDMLNSRMNKLGKLPPIMGKRASPNSPPPGSEGPGSPGTSGTS